MDCNFPFSNSDDSDFIFMMNHDLINVNDSNLVLDRAALQNISAYVDDATSFESITCTSDFNFKETDLFSNYSGNYSNENLGHCCIQDFNYKIDAHNLLIVEINTRSLPKNFSKVKQFLGAVERKPDILILVETWLENSYIKLYQLPGYEFILIPRQGKKGGGVGAYISLNLNFVVRKDLMTNFKVLSFELLIFEIITKAYGSIMFLCVYRPPSTSINMFITEFSNVVGELINAKPSQNLLTVGDYNIDMINMNNVCTRSFLNAMATYNLIPAIFTPTRVTDTSTSLIDNLFVTSDVQLDQCGSISDDIADHFPIFAVIKTNGLTSEAVCKTNSNDNKMRKYGKKNYTHFNIIMKNFNWVELHRKIIHLHFFENKSADELYDFFFDSFYGIYNEAFPLHSQKRSRNCNQRSKLSNDPWMTPELLNCCVVKSKLFKTYKRFKNLVSKTRYKNYAKELKSKIRSAELLYYSNIFSSHTASRDVWKNINTLIRPTHTPSVNSTFFNDGITITDSDVIVQGFNTFFTGVGKSIADNVPKVDDSPLIYLGPSNPSSIYLHPTDDSEVKIIISNLKQNSSPELDSICPGVVKAASNFISRILAVLINYSLEEGVFPNSLKNAKITPIYKDSDKK